jgi:cytochrome P450
VARSQPLGALLKRFPGLTLATGRQELRWRDNLLFRGVETLPVRLS